MRLFDVGVSSSEAPKTERVLVFQHVVALPWHVLWP